MSVSGLVNSVSDFFFRVAGFWRSFSHKNSGRYLSLFVSKHLELCLANESHLLGFIIIIKFMSGDTADKASKKGPL